MWHGSLMREPHFRTLSLVVATALVAACTQFPQKPAAADAPATASPSEPSKIGTVGLVQELKERGMTTGNWAGVIGSVFTNETGKDVIRVRYEVTVFYQDGSQGAVIVDQRPGVRPGDRVRVTGNRIEPLER